MGIDPVPAGWYKGHLGRGAMLNSGQTKGYIYVVIAAIMWSSSGTAGKALFKGGMTPFELVQIRVTLSSALLAAAFGLFARGFSESD